MVYGMKKCALRSCRPFRDPAVLTGGGIVISGAHKKTHHSQGLLYWDLLMAIGVTASLVSFGLHIGIPHRATGIELALDLLFSALFLADTALLKKNRPHIEQGTLGTLLGIVPAFPFALALYFAGATTGAPFLLLLVRFGKIPSLFRRFRERHDDFLLPGWVTLALSLLIIAAAFHTLACFWLFFSPFENETPLTSYNMALYWTITTVATIGYGDITPKTNEARLYTMLVMFLGVAFYSLIIGQVSRLMTQSDHRKAAVQDKLDVMSALFRHYSIPPDLQQSVLKFYSHLLSSTLNENEEKILAELPPALQSEIRVYMNVTLIARVSLFKSVSRDCLLEAAQGLEQFLFNPGQSIIRKGDQGEEMFLLSHGTVRVHIGDNHLAMLESGSFFGEMALIENDVRTADVTAVGYCVVYRLSKSKFIELTGRHADLKKAVDDMVKTRQM